MCHVDAQPPDVRSEAELFHLSLQPVYELQCACSTQGVLALFELVRCAGACRPVLYVLVDKEGRDVRLDLAGVGIDFRVRPVLAFYPAVRVLTREPYRPLVEA